MLEHIVPTNFYILLILNGSFYVFVYLYLLYNYIKSFLKIVLRCKYITNKMFVNKG